jgi:hypothetical protein
MSTGRIYEPVPERGDHYGGRRERYAEAYRALAAR